ncbi:MAG: methionyl-tRNA formyltransferase [Acidimicrobiia bacterium]
MTGAPLVFFGTPADAVVPFEALIAAGFEIGLVVTQPDRKRGRGGALVPSPVKEAAGRHGVPVVTPERARDAVAEIRATGARRGLVVAFGQLLPQVVLDAFAEGLVNLHYSLLPRWRGAAPVERAILAGDSETGMCVMGVEPALDAGPVYARTVVTIGADETAGELHARLTDAGARLLVDTLAVIDAITPEPQVGEPTYAEKLTVEEFALDLARPATELVRQVRAGNPRPGAWLDVDGARLKVWRAHVDDAGRFVPDEVQPAGKRAMPYHAWRAGARGADPFA